MDDDCWTSLTSLPEDCGLTGSALAGYRTKVSNVYIFADSVVLVYDRYRLIGRLSAKNPADYDYDRQPTDIIGQVLRVKIIKNSQFF